MDILDEQLCVTALELTDYSAAGSVIPWTLPVVLELVTLIP